MSLSGIALSLKRVPSLAFNLRRIFWSISRIIGNKFGLGIGLQKFEMISLFRLKNFNCVEIFWRVPVNSLMPGPQKLDRTEIRWSHILLSLLTHSQTQISLSFLTLIQALAYTSNLLHTISLSISIQFSFSQYSVILFSFFDSLYLSLFHCFSHCAFYFIFLTQTLLHIVY